MADNDTYEVWIHRPDDSWVRALDPESKDDVIQKKQRALAIAGKVVSHDPLAVEVLVIERRLLASYNGQALLDPPKKKPEAPVERKLDEKKLEPEVKG